LPNQENSSLSINTSTKLKVNISTNGQRDEGFSEEKALEQAKND
jgi:hypothetical protein